MKKKVTKTTKINPSPQQDDQVNIAEFAEEQHKYLREYIQSADSKAIFFFSICSALLAFLYTHHTSDHWLKPVNTWTILDLVPFVAMFGLAISGVFLLFVVIPRLGGSKRGLIYFNAIAEYNTAKEYASAIIHLSETERVIAKLEHCYDLSKICQSKFCKLVLGLYFGGLSFLACLTYFLFY